jgi:hypothetical protein
MCTVDFDAHNCTDIDPTCMSTNELSSKFRQQSYTTGVSSVPSATKSIAMIKEAFRKSRLAISVMGMDLADPGRPNAVEYRIHG